MLPPSLMMLNFNIKSHVKTLNPPPEVDEIPEGEEAKPVEATFTEVDNSQSFGLLVDETVCYSLSKIYWFLKKAMSLTSEQTRALSILDHLYGSLTSQDKPGAEDQPVLKVLTVSFDEDSGKIQAGAKYSWQTVWGMNVSNLLTVTFPEIRVPNPNDPTGLSYSADTFQISFGTNVAILGL